VLDGVAGELRRIIAIAETELRLVASSTLIPQLRM